MKKLLSIALALCMALSLCVTTWAADPVAKIGSTEYGSLADALNAAAGMTTEDVTVDILADIALTGEWTPVNVARGHSDGLKVIINGNNHTITGLNKPLFGVLWVVSHFEINNLTISNSEIGNVDEGGKNFAAAFVGYTEACVAVTLNNCHLTNSKVQDAHWNGGLIGYAAGYDNQGDGPVFETVTFNNCSVTNSTISGPGSAGGLMGHAAGNPWTKVVVNNATVSDNTITCTEADKHNKAGSLFGTTGSAGVESNGQKGDVVVSANVSGNTVICDGTTISTVYGRQGVEGGTMTVTGGSYDSAPLGTDHAGASYGTDTPVATNDGNYYVGSDSIAAAANSGKEMTVIVGGAINGLKPGATIIVSENVTGTKLNGDPVEWGYYHLAEESTHHHTRRQPTTTTTTDTTTTDTTTKTDAVTSAKTFDAGVAVYAAMGILSLTGSAWVVGKKRV